MSTYALYRQVVTERGMLTYKRIKNPAIDIIKKRIKELIDISKESHADFIENEIKALEAILKQIKGVSK